VEMSMGAAFGLFAVFSMLRYRTEDISIKDMTYMFLVIAMGLINAVTKGSWDELLLVMSIIILVTWLLESRVLMRKEVSKIVMYENIELIKPENKQQLIEDLQNRLGVKVNSVTIGKIDFLRDTAQVQVHYYE
jgi:ribosomal protein S24E